MQARLFALQGVLTAHELPLAQYNYRMHKRPFPGSSTISISSGNPQPTLKFGANLHLSLLNRGIAHSKVVLNDRSAGVAIVDQLIGLANNLVPI